MIFIFLAIYNIPYKHRKVSFDEHYKSPAIKIRIRKGPRLLVIMIVRRRNTLCITLVFFFTLYLFLTLLNDVTNSSSPPESTKSDSSPSNKTYCSCRVNATRRHRSRSSSSCSDPFSQLTPTGQNVIAYTFHEFPDERKRRLSDQVSVYQMGLLENLHLMRELYPGFVMRIYTKIPAGQFCWILCDNPDLHWCDIRNTPSHGDLSLMNYNAWRFLAWGDPTVDIFLSRDLDSVLTEREQAAVADWLNETTKAIHIMKDNQYHNVPILGGLWGASNSRLAKAIFPSEVAEIRKKIILSSTAGGFEDLDEFILKEGLFPKYQDLAVTHDSYHCVESRRETLVRPFPVQRKNAESDFVGNPGLGRVKYVLPPCPVDCRPSYGQDWEYC